MPVRCSICCARSSASTTCSVKNFEPITSLFFGPFLHAHKNPAATTSAIITAIHRRTLNHLQLSFEQSERPIRRQRQQRRGNRSRQNHRIAHHRHAAKNKRT